MGRATNPRASTVSLIIILTPQAPAHSDSRVNAVTLGKTGDFAAQWRSRRAWLLGGKMTVMITVSGSLQFREREADKAVTPHSFSVSSNTVALRHPRLQ